jgi:hypothetical protein
VLLNQKELGNLAGHRQYEAAASAGCMVPAVVVRQGEEMETIGMAVGQK